VSEVSAQSVLSAAGYPTPRADPGEAYGYRVLGMAVMPDHVHLLDVNLHIGIAKLVGQIKGYTAHTLREAFPWLKKRLPSVWTRSKFISSVRRQLS